MLDYGWEILKTSIEAAESWTAIIELIIICVAVLAVEVLHKRKPRYLKRVLSIPFLSTKERRTATFAITLFAFHVLIFAPYKINQKLRTEAEEIKRDLTKLSGFIDQTLIGGQVGATNSLVYLQVSIGNAGKSPSVAEGFKLKVKLPNGLLTNAEPIEIGNEYRTKSYTGNKTYLIDIKRDQLISEKTYKAIPQGESRRGWIAFKVHGILPNQIERTNLILSFSDINGNIVTITNGYWRGKPAKDFKMEELPAILPGSESIMTEIESTENLVGGVWLPPELPSECSNVLVGFGANVLTYPRVMAEITEKGTNFPIKYLPDDVVKNIEKLPGYSPRQEFIGIGRGQSLFIDGKNVTYPITPIIVSNRLYVEAEIPFLNEKRRIVMSAAFDSELHIPLLWDRNYSTNYYAGQGLFVYEIVNEMTNPVLQVFYTAPNAVHVNGIFLVDTNMALISFGEQPKLFTIIDTVLEAGAVQTNKQMPTNSETYLELVTPETNETTESFGEKLKDAPYRPKFPGQRAIFKYPSNRNLGVFAEVLTTNATNQPNAH